MKWEVGSRKWEVGSRKWEVENACPAIVGRAKGLPGKATATADKMGNARGRSQKSSRRRMEQIISRRDAENAKKTLPLRLCVKFNFACFLGASLWRQPRKRPGFFPTITALFCCSSLLLISSCTSSEKEVDLAFYHWQTQLQLPDQEKNYLDSLSVHQLYVKFFDVDWDEAEGQAVPLAPLQVNNLPPDSLAVIPAVFITNRTFSNLAGADIDSLAARIHRKIFQLAGQFAHRPIREIQMDCDWSGTTRESYFYLLRQLKQRLLPQDIQLSVTIRLHQARYRTQTGVPPADRGVLMCYNTGEATDWTTENSILSSRTVAPYLSGLETYPLPLDLALPIFAWGVLFREGRMIRLINDLREEALQDTSRFAPLGAHRFQVVRSTYLNGYYLYEGDRLRLESVQIDELRENAGLLSPRWPTDRFRLIFYHLDASTIRHYPAEELESIRQIMLQR